MIKIETKKYKKKTIPEKFRGTSMSDPISYLSFALSWTEVLVSWRFHEKNSPQGAHDRKTLFTNAGRKVNFDFSLIDCLLRFLCGKCTGLLACILDYRSLAVQIRRLKSEHRLVWMDESLLARLARHLVFSRKHQPYSTINKGLVEDYIHPGAKWVFVGIAQFSS